MPRFPPPNPHPHTPSPIARTQYRATEACRVTGRARFRRATLATVSGIQREERSLPRSLRTTVEDEGPETPLPPVRFPWSSLEALHARAAALRSLSDGGQAVFALTTPGAVP
jgi:hypothetical protein